MPNAAVPTIKLERGQPSKVITAGAGTGTTQSSVFSCGNSLNASDYGQCVVAPGAETGTFTALKVDLYVSLDGGFTFALLQAAISLGTTASPLAAVLDVLVPGGIYQFNTSTFTGGTTFDLWIAANA